MGKKLIGLGILAVAFLLTSCGESKSNASSGVKVGNQSLYSTKIGKVTEDSNNNWVLSGTSKAPNGAKIIVTPANTESLDYKQVSAESKSLASWAKVENGKFTVLVDPVELIDGDESQGQTIKTIVFAISNYNKAWTKSQISGKIASTAKKNFNTKVLTVSSKQASYYSSLGKDSSSSSTSSESSSSSSSSATNDLSSYNTGITYDQLARTPKQYKGQKVTFTGEVVQVLEDGGYTGLRLAVNGNTDNIILVDMKNKVLNGSRVLENDLVTVYGESYGLTSYKSTQGEKITIPGMLGSQLKDQGTAPDNYGE